MYNLSIGSELWGRGIIYCSPLKLNSTACFLILQLRNLDILLILYPFHPYYFGMDIMLFLGLNETILINVAEPCTK